jgi:hypothetical protein
MALRSAAGCARRDREKNRKKTKGNAFAIREGVERAI